MAQNTFKQFQTLTQFLNDRKASKEDLKLVLTDKGYQLLTLFGKVVSTIHGPLKSRNPEQTAKTLASINLTFGIPHDDGLACAMEDKSTWEEVSIF